MKKLFLSAAIAASLTALPATAENTYVGLAYNALDVEADLLGRLATADLSTISVVVGHNFLPYLAIEGFASLGVSEDSFDRMIGNDTVSATRFEIEQETAFGVNLVASLPLGRGWDIYGKLGYADLSFDDTDSDKASASGASFGAGFDYNFRDTHVLFLEYMNFAEGEYDDFAIDIDPVSYTLGYKYRF